MKTHYSLLLSLILPFLSQATTLHVGAGFAYADFEAAALVATPGDTILIHGSTYPGSQFVTNLQGTANAWIHVLAAPGDTIIFQGGNEGWHLTDAAYVHISGFTFENQNANTVNIDDGGTYVTPSHHLLIENCVFRDIAGTGNNDLLKMSGVDSFEVRNCTFLNGAAGGSGIDMVGCHHGIIQDNSWENMGSNCIQAKGGTQYIRIEGNTFKNGGQRTLNLGGSTGLQFFRPDTAHFEAADIQVYSNVIMGSWAAIAYVGSVNVEVVNNTIFKPQNWVLRILQETVDPNRFLPCGNNTFQNNIVYFTNSLRREANIGPDTDPTSFTFSNNLWFNQDDLNWSGPTTLPVSDVDLIVGSDPLFQDTSAADFSIPMRSPAVSMGLQLAEPTHDWADVLYGTPRSIGAFEGNPSTGITSDHALFPFTISPNPASHFLKIENPLATSVHLVIFAMNGQKIREEILGPLAFKQIDTRHLPSGIYFIQVKADGFQVFNLKWVKQ
jgi:hypothetical protein